MDTISILTQLTSVCGVSGAEESAAKTVSQLLSPYGKTQIDSLGNVLFTDEGGNGPLLLLDAHIDEIGMIVTYITDGGFLKVSACGGIDSRVLLGQRVTVYGLNRLTGIIASTPPHLETDSSAAVSAEEIYIDIGLSKDEAERLVSPGDRVIIENRLCPLAGGRVTSKALDNRAGAAAVILAIAMLHSKKTACRIVALFSVQEETGCAGARTGAYSIAPDMAVAVDVSFAKTHGETEESCGFLGKGPMIGIAPSLSRKMSDTLIKLAEENNIPYQLEVMSGKTGTNADAIGIARGGTAAVTLSIPEKHMHTPAEIADLNDIENTARLIALYAERAAEIFD